MVETAVNWSNLVGFMVSTHFDLIWGLLVAAKGPKRPSLAIPISFVAPCGVPDSDDKNIFLDNEGTLNMKQTEEAKMVGYKLSKNDWVTPFFVIFRSVREKLLVTVFFDHPVVVGL